ncbi:MAG: GIY-YIG nuclease family protein [Desulfuromusa sp.]|jgi:putative endonuclease|nr:GIY-YIG nuclease family protein [Desulfuromusa sp.]
MHWQVYIILCSDDSLYTGITTDIKRRFAQHAAGTGAKYFRRCSPCRVVYSEVGHDRSSASCREARIKKLSTENKRRLIDSPDNQIKVMTDNADNVEGLHV